MSVPRLLRLIAIAIAGAGVADPTLTREMPVPQPLTMAVLETSGLSAAERLRAELDADYDVTIHTHPAGGAASACPAAGGCIVVSSGAAPQRITSGAQVLGGLRVEDSRDDHNLAIARLAAAGRVGLNGNAVLNVQLGAAGIHGSSEIQVFDDGVLVGSAVYEWPAAGGASPRRADVAVDWVPMAAGARQLRVMVIGAEGERMIEDNTADVGVDVRSELVRILMYEPEATWLGTFVRRTLEGDPRFRVQTRTRLGPALTVSRGAGGPGARDQGSGIRAQGTERGRKSQSLTRATLDGIGAVIVSAPGSLDAADVELLERFVRVRGGSVVLLLDRPSSGPVSRLMPPLAGERREAEARPVGLLRASELLTFDASAIGVSVVESAAGQPVVVSRAMGRGRVIASGAMDAWRYRDEGFSRFWPALVADAASAAGEPLEVALDQTVMTPGATTGLTVEWRTIDDLPATITARAWLQCGDEAPAPVRLWPDQRAGRFRGVVSGDIAGRCEVGAAITGPTAPTATAALLVTPDVRIPRPGSHALDAAVRAHGGIVVQAGEEAALVSRVHALLATTREPRGTRPMRSPWWIVPFAACLGGEWWLRRRGGLR